MGEIIVIEDDPLFREQTLHHLEDVAGLGRHPFSRVEALNVPAYFPAERLAEALAHRRYRKGSYAVLLLDLHLGKHIDDGFQLWRYIRHFWDGAVVLHSSQTRDPEVAAEAVRLGIRFGCEKLADELPELLEAAYRVASIRSGTLGAGLFYEQSPIPPWAPAPELDNLVTWLEALKFFGRGFDGTASSADFALAERIEQQTKLLVRASCEDSRFARDHAAEREAARVAATESGNEEEAFRYGDLPHFFEEWETNTIPLLMRLTKTLREDLPHIEPFISFPDPVAV